MEIENRKSKSKDELICNFRRIKKPMDIARNRKVFTCIAIQIKTLFLVNVFTEKNVIVVKQKKINS